MTASRPRPGVAALVFDMDGTLVDSTAAVTVAYRDAVVQGGGRQYTREEVVAAYPLGPPGVILSHLLGRECGDADLAAYHERLAELTHQVVVYPGVQETLTELRRRGVPLAVFTGASRRAAHIVLEGTGLLGALAVLVGGDQVARPKPDPDGIHLACKLLGADPATTAYVGDSPLDLEAARRSGGLAVAAAWGHLYIPDVPADLVANKPGDLLAAVTP